MTGYLSSIATVRKNLNQTDYKFASDSLSQESFGRSYD